MLYYLVVMYALHFLFSGLQLDLKLKYAQTMEEKSIAAFQEIRRIAQVILEIRLDYLFRIAIECIISCNNIYDPYAVRFSRQGD